MLPLSQERNAVENMTQFPPVRFSKTKKVEEDLILVRMWGNRCSHILWSELVQPHYRTFINNQTLGHMVISPMVEGSADSRGCPGPIHTHELPEAFCVQRRTTTPP